MGKVLVHIGYPKCMSTSLQMSFFNHHEGINFSGVGINDPISYKNKEIEYIFEILLKYSRRSHFEDKKLWAQEVIKEFIDNDKLNVFSSEYLAMSITPQEIDPDDKIDRVCEIFSGLSPEVLVITREKEYLIRSFYGELVKLGYCESYNEYASWIENFSDRNFIKDLDFDWKIEHLEKRFSKVHTLDFDDIKSDHKKIHDFFKKNYNLEENHYIEIKNENPSFSSLQIEEIRLENEKKRRGIGRGILYPFEIHRNRSLNTIDGKRLSEKELFKDVIMKRKSLSKHLPMKHET